MTTSTPPASWEKSAASPTSAVAKKSSNRWKFAIISVVLFGAIAFMILSGTLGSGRFFITVNEVLSRPDLVGKSVKISGAVVGSTINVDPNTQTISFTIAHVSDSIAELQDQGGLAKALHEAVVDPDAKRIRVVVKNQPKPDLLQDEAQAILTGHMGEDGIFYADELNLKCPSKYQADVPQQSEGIG
ncbi:MAG: cytochrome c maturation protein CcmE [Anaerolineae bacterium]|nr:cytochrome c maturation protein CcmE [Anaerolineae bacterium]